jgi:AraC-like DNA-binding protein
MQQSGPGKTLRDKSDRVAEGQLCQAIAHGSLASTARMGVSTLHHQFRALTAMSPLQYQKQLRLQSARELMLMDGLDATSAAYEVGYESVSQFSREYSRFFGQAPIRDIKAIRPQRRRGQGCLARVAL